MGSFERRKRKGAAKNEEEKKEVEEQLLPESKRPRLDPEGSGSASKAAASPKTTKKKNSVTNSSSDDDAEWNRMFFQLMLYKAHNGNFSVKPSDQEHNGLYKWISLQRKEYKLFQKDALSALNEDRVKVLESIEFAFSTRGEGHWNRSYEKLKKWKEEHGHVLVPRLSEVPGLGDWVINQRLQHKDLVQGKPTPLTNQRRELLDQLEFVWQVRNRPNWSSRFDELVKYKDKNGDTRVPQHYSDNRALGKWVAKQREQYKLLKKGKHSFLTPDRLEKLTEVGFVWAVRGDSGDDFMDV